jgi:hypothetical protein
MKNYLITNAHIIQVITAMDMEDAQNQAKKFCDENHPTHIHEIDENSELNSKFLVEFIYYVYNSCLAQVTASLQELYDVSEDDPATLIGVAGAYTISIEGDMARFVQVQKPQRFTPEMRTTVEAVSFTNLNEEQVFTKTVNWREYHQRELAKSQEIVEEYGTLLRNVANGTTTKI